MRVAEGDFVRSPDGTVTCVYDTATCTETGRTLVIHGNKGHTFVSPRSLEGYVRVDRRGVVLEPTR